MSKEDKNQEELTNGDNIGFSKAKIVYWRIAAKFRNSIFTRIWEWKHKRFFFVLFLLLVVLAYIFFRFKLCNKIETLIISVATGLFASMIIALYSEIKSYELSDLEELMLDIELFSRDVHHHVTQIGKGVSAQKAVELYDDIMEKQDRVSKKYYSEKHLRKPIPAFGYQIDFDDQEINQLFIDAREGRMEDSVDKMDFIMMIQDDLWIIIRQNNYCLENIHETLKYARKVL